MPLDKQLKGHRMNPTNTKHLIKALNVLLLASATVTLGGCPLSAQQPTAYAKTTQSVSFLCSTSIEFAQKALDAILIVKAPPKDSPKVDLEKLLAYWDIYDTNIQGVQYECPEDYPKGNSILDTYDGTFKHVEGLLEAYIASINPTNKEPL